MNNRTGEYYHIVYVLISLSIGNSLTHSYSSQNKPASIDNNNMK